MPNKKSPPQARSKTSQTQKIANPTLTVNAAGTLRQLNVRPDGLDFRDLMYVPTLVEVPVRRELNEYREVGVPILDQGQEGACTGYGLSTVAHYLLRTRTYVPDTNAISPHMLYDLARRYDEWAGVDYEGSSCRGAMKGWYKHGVCAETLWTSSGNTTRALTETLITEAANRPLGAYFRVNHTDLVAMHSAIAEVGVLYASATVHAGWRNVEADGHIPFSTDILGGHAFAIVAYDQDGFWIQNSWGSDWGCEGFCHISYEDWLTNGTDTWVARLGAPVKLTERTGKITNSRMGLASSSGVVLNDIRPHVISIGNDGALDPHGDIGTSADTVREIFEEDFSRITKNWKKKRLVIYAHGGLVGQAGAMQTVADYRQAMLAAECYPLAFIWKSDYWTTIENMLSDAARRRRPEGFLDNAKDFMLDRLDDALEPIARLATGKAEWDEMKENALLATVSKNGGARLVAEALVKLIKDPDVELHLVGHSAGSILLAPLLQYLVAQGDIRTGPLSKAKLKGLGLCVTSCTLWAPACTVELFKETYLPPIKEGQIGQFNLFTLMDNVEQNDNCAHIYNKSLLYLVSNAFETQARIPVIHPDGEPILGMAKFILQDPDMKGLFTKGSTSTWITAPNNATMGAPEASSARHHGDFDNDEATVRATLARILKKESPNALPFSPSVTAQQRKRGLIDLATNSKQGQ